MAVGHVPRPEPTEELDRIETNLQAEKDVRVDLVAAVRQARGRGFSWTQIGVILGVTRQAAQQRFGALVESEPTVELTHQPVDRAPVEPPPAQVTDPVAAAPRFDFTAMTTMTDDQLVAAAGRLPRDEKLTDPYLRAQREAIVVMLYKRGWTQRKIAPVIGKTNQRVSQIVTGFYDRLKQEWEDERARRDRRGQQ
jgi:hypothetical protein